MFLLRTLLLFCLMYSTLQEGNPPVRNQQTQENKNSEVSSAKPNQESVGKRAEVASNPPVKENANNPENYSNRTLSFLKVVMCRLHFPRGHVFVANSSERNNSELHFNKQGCRKVAKRRDYSLLPLLNVLLCYFTWLFVHG